MELADLRKQGIAPLPKPPPGVGLLPTPGPGSPPDGGKKIPSLFEIKVQPTVDLAQKIALRYYWNLLTESPFNCVYIQNIWSRLVCLHPI